MYKAEKKAMKLPRNTIATLCVLLTMLAVAGCGKVEDEFSTHQCYFHFNATIHNTSIIKNLCTSYEYYGMVTKQPLSGKTFTLVTTLFSGEKQSDNITTDMETRESCILGLNNGLIIGFSQLNQVLYVFDRQCPNCFEETGSTNHPLSWGENDKTVKCNHCHRSYNLSNGGICEQGSKLYRYRATFTGDQLYVQNR